MPIQHHDEIKNVLTHQENYWGAISRWQDSGYGPTFAMHRDSDQLEISNYETILSAFRDNFEFARDFVVEGSSHWAVGWMDQIVVRVLDCSCDDDEIQDRDIRYDDGVWYCDTCDTECRPSDIFVESLEYLARLQGYPVLDEEDLSRREYEDMMQYLAQEVGEEHADALYTHLYEVYSACRSDDIRYRWIEEWKAENVDTDD